MGKFASFLMASLDTADAKVGEPLARRHFTPEVSQHLKSRRIARGEGVEFLGGRGLRLECECEDVPSQRYRVKVVRQDAPLAPRIELYLALPKGEALGEAVAQATEIGVARLHFVKTEHSQIPKELTLPPLARAQRIADAACEQCSRSWKLEIHPQWIDVAEALREKSADTITVVADEALAAGNVIGFANGATPAGAASFRLFIGPEGGWSEKERQLFGEVGALRLGLGALVLRMPTALVAACFHLRSTATP